MSLPHESASRHAADLPSAGMLGKLQACLDRVNGLLIALSALAAGAAGCVLTWEVAGRYFFKIPSYWQDELSVFLLVGATFGAASWIQTRRGHVAITALQHVLPRRVELVRGVLADLVSLAFCTFFCWKCWTLLIEAIDESQISNTPWGPPLWIPYGVMAAGMTMLVAQLLLQCLARVVPSSHHP